MRLTNDKIKNKAWLSYQYINLEKSVIEIRRENGWGVNTIKRYLTKYNISIRGHDNHIVSKQRTNHKTKSKSHKRINSGGYVLIYYPEHPNAPKTGYIFEHRLNAEKIIGRVLNHDEYVHHIDMDNSNNDISNLFIAKRGEHRRTHASFNRLCKELLNMKVVKFNKKKGVYELGLQ